METNILHIRNIIFLCLGILCVELTSCNHKDLDYEDIPTFEPEIVFDWRNAPDATPASMAVYLYDKVYDKTLLYQFHGRDGGFVKLPLGSYDGISINSDNSDWARFRNTDDKNGFEIYTQSVNELTVHGLHVESVPRAEGTQDEPVVNTPGMLWGSQSDNLSYLSETNSTKFVFYPEELICHYDITVKDVENIGYLDGSALDATLSGMAGSYIHGQHRPGTTRVTFPVILVTDPDTDSLYGEFLTFGEIPSISVSHILTIYMILDDGTRIYSTFDVTDQIKNAPDPRHVHIVISGLQIPEPLIQGSGLNPDVNEWNSVNIDISM